MTRMSDRIRLLRKTEHLTQKDFSRRLLISQSYLSGLENGNEIPANKLIRLICHEFGVNESWLLGSSEEMYDEVYENDKAALVETSNTALLNIMELLSTKSNVEYGLYANNLNLFSSILASPCSLDEGSKLVFLDLLQTFCMDLDRMLFVFSNNNENSSHLHNHRDIVMQDLEGLLNYIIEKK